MKTITKGFIAGLRPKKKRYDLYDDCLHTWVTPTGRVGFAFQTHRGGQGVRVPIATFPNNKLDDHQRGDVQRKYQELYISMEVGSNSTDTVGDLFQAYLTEHCPTLRSGKAYQGVLNNTFKEIHGVRLRDLKKRHLLDMHKSLSDRQGLQTSAMRVLRGVLNWGVQHEWLDASPWQDMPKYKSRKRQRVLKDSEIEALWPHLNPILRFILLSGQRIGEVIAMRWVDLEIGAVPVREHNEPTRYPEIKWVQPDNKTGVAHALPLPPLVVSQLPHGFDGIDPVFGGKGVVFK